MLLHKSAHKFTAVLPTSGRSSERVTCSMELSWLVVTARTTVTKPSRSSDCPINKCVCACRYLIKRWWPISYNNSQNINSSRCKAHIDLTRYHTDRETRTGLACCWITLTAVGSKRWRTYGSIAALRLNDENRSTINSTITWSAV